MIIDKKKQIKTKLRKSNLLLHQNAKIIVLLKDSGE